MPQQKIVWTALPNGRVTDGPHAGRWRVSLVASPRLRPEAAGEQQLGAFDALRMWPRTLRDLELRLQLGAVTHPLEIEALPGPDTWDRLFDDSTPVAGFEFKDMAAVNLRSYPVRNVLGFARREYGRLAVSAGADHPVLLPWRKESPLGGLLGELGTRVVRVNLGRRSIDMLQPGFGRFHPRYEPGERPKDPGRVLPSQVDQDTDAAVFNERSCIPGPQLPVDPEREGRAAVFPVRALPPDWEPPQPGATDARSKLMAGFASADEYSFYQADRFYRRRTPTAAEVTQRRPTFADNEPALAEPVYDFHRMLASYGDYPAVMRALGLVIDCLLPEGTALDAAPAAPAAPLTGRMRPLVKGPHAGLDHVALQTAWEAGAERFVTAARTRDHRSGLLALQHANDRHSPKQDGPFDVYQVDPDGTALKTVDYLLTAQNLVGKSLQLGADGEVTYTTGDAQPVAALRSGGLGVSRHGRAGMVAIDARAAALKNQAIETSPAAAARVVLFAEDVLRGYRVDVHAAGTGRWRSLCEREGQYRLVSDGTELPAVKDEGYVKSASTTGQGDDDHYLHESLFRWAGWSLVAPRPGRSLVAETEAGLQSERATVPEEDPALTAVATQGNNLQVSFKARRGSLPRLRFGERYRFRARLVDLAGNSLAPEDRSLGKDEQASDPVPYARFEPVDPPVLALQSRLSEGESLERMVIRSDARVTAADYLQGDEVKAFYQPPPTGQGSPDFDYHAVNVRHVVPPKAAQALCETHGCFDAALGGGDAAAIKQAYAVGAREAGSLLDPVPGAQVELVTPRSGAGIATVEAPGELIAAPDQADPARDRFAAGQYVIHREALVPVPYLPDPCAGGIALQGVPGLSKAVEGVALGLLAPGLVGAVLAPGVRAARVPGASAETADPDAPNADFRWVLLIDFDTDPQPGDTGWPDDRRSLCIALHDQPAEATAPACGEQPTPADPPKWDEASRTLHLFLPQGRIARLRYASFAHDQYLSHLGLPQWIDAPGAADQARLAALTGSNWMLTPFRRLVLVHATQRPVCRPALLSVLPRRLPGANHVDLMGRHHNVLLHGPSTGQFEVLAQWKEWIDDPERDDPANPGPRRVDCEGALGEIRLAENHPNPVTLEQAVLAQRAFPAGGGQTTPAELAERANAPGNRHAFGDTRFRRVRYRLRASTRFAEYLPPALHEQPALVSVEGDPLDQSRLRVLTRSGLDIDSDPGAPMLPQDAQEEAPWGLVVPASAAPDAPRVVYTLPTFRWNRSAGAQGRQTSVREGHTLRVYLDRPWFSSGDGELLAVVVALRNPADPTPSFADIPAALSDRVTQWGLDPLWESVHPHASAEAVHFPQRVAEAVAMLPDGGGQVGVVAHRVHWSPERALWYCDIEIATGRSYMPFVRLALARWQPNALGGAQLSQVVLADFAQLLPRRRAELQRSGGRVKLSLHGPVPTRGPMRDKLREGLPTESPYADISFRPLPGAAVEMGQNRIELVLQKRDPAIDSDLAWQDVSVLASGPAVPGAGLLVRQLQPADGGVAPAATEPVDVLLRGGRSLRFDRAEPRLPPGEGIGRGGTELRGGGLTGTETGGLGGLLQREPDWPGRLGWLLDPVVWQGEAALPDTGAAPARLVLREFERYYTDRSVPERRAGAVRRRRVVEERLVYAEFFDLAAS